MYSLNIQGVNEKPCHRYNSSHFKDEETQVEMMANVLS